MSDKNELQRKVLQLLGEINGYNRSTGQVESINSQLLEAVAMFNEIKEPMVSEESRYEQ